MLEDDDVEPAIQARRAHRKPIRVGTWSGQIARTARATATGKAGSRCASFESCDAEPGDQVILTTAQFDRICRSKGIKNLIYTGFATNMCILGSAGATQPMLGYGYRVFPHP